MNFSKKYLNIKIINFLLVLSVVFSTILSYNPRSSFFYGDVIDHNLIIYLLLITFLYAINNTWREGFEKTRYIFFLIPVISTIIIAILLKFSFFKSIIDWSYFSAISIFSLMGSIFLFFKYKQIWKKVFFIVLFFLSSIMLISGEMAIFTPEKVQTKVANKFMGFYKVSFNDVRPSMETSWTLAKQSFLENKMLGAGPNQFSNVWMKYRPASSMTDSYYNSNIENASSNFFKLLIEMGIVAILIIIVALYKVIYLFNEAKQYKGKVAFYNLIHILYIAVGTIMIWFITNNIIFLLYYIAILYIPSNNESMNSDNIKIRTKKNFFLKYIAYIIFFLLILLLICKYLSYQMIDKAIVKYDNDKDSKALLSRIDLANKIYPNNFANSLKSRVYLQEATNLYLNASKEGRDEKLMAEFKILIDKSLSEANLSVYKNLSNPYVYINRATIYETASILDNKTYYELATSDYNKAIIIDPYNPDHMLGLSKLEYAKGMKDKTGLLIDRMLSVKPNFLPAYLTLADMMEIEQSRDKKAYVLQEALKANPDNQNVAYMLAVEYFKLGLYKDYTFIMDDLIKLNPNLEQLKKELEEAKKFIAKQSSVPISEKNKSKDE